MTINEDNVNGVLHMTAEGKGRSRIASTGRSGASKTPAQRKKEALIKFAQPIVATLPIQYREQQVFQNGASEPVRCADNWSPAAASGRRNRYWRVKTASRWHVSAADIVDSVHN